MKSLTCTYAGWGVITGATSGIGRSFAEQLAQAGMNLVLVARSTEALEWLSHELRARYAIQTRVLALDLAEPISRETLDLETLDLDVGMLINNAAVEQRGSFLRHTPEDLRRVIELNVAAPTELGQRFARRFAARGRGGIIFVSGSIAYQGVPLLANYAATKAHQLNLAEALHHELRSQGVDVLALAPGLTRTPMVGRLEESIDFRRIGMMQLSPDRVARTALRLLGRRGSIVTGAQYKVFAFLTKRVLSRSAGAWLFGTLIRMAFVDKSLLEPEGRSTPNSKAGGSVDGTRALVCNA